MKQFEDYGTTIQTESANFWAKFNEYEKQLSINENSRSQMAAKTQFYAKQLQKLMSRTFHNEVFLISSEDEIATISGFRLGCTQKVDVSWEERNAAIGQVVYLLCVQAHHLGYSFEDICLQPQGAFSLISRV